MIMKQYKVKKHYIKLKKLLQKELFKRTIRKSLSFKEVNLLQTVAQKSREVSSYSCMPRMFVKPLDECDDYELNSVGIRTDDMNDEFV